MKKQNLTIIGPGLAAGGTDLDRMPEKRKRIRPVSRLGMGNNRQRRHHGHGCCRHDAPAHTEPSHQLGTTPHNSQHQPQHRKIGITLQQKTMLSYADQQKRGQPDQKPSPADEKIRRFFTKTDDRQRDNKDYCKRSHNLPQGQKPPFHRGYIGGKTGRHQGLP